MSYRHLALSCNCGEVPARIEEVGFTDDHQLVIHWWCGQCQRVVYLTKPLTECWQECPKPGSGRSKNASDFGTGDLVFLRSVGIKAT